MKKLMLPSRHRRSIVNKGLILRLISIFRRFSGGRQRRAGLALGCPEREFLPDVCRQSILKWCKKLLFNTFLV